jgi:hypothetical protein
LLQPLLLLLLLTVLLTLLHLGPMLLLSSKGLGRLKKLRDKLLVCRDSQQLLLLVRQRCLLPLLHTKEISGLAAHVHGIDSCQTHHPPHTLV